MVIVEFVLDNAVGIFEKTVVHRAPLPVFRRDSKRKQMEKTTGFKLDGPLYATLDNAAAEAKALAETGYDGIYTLEGAHDPFYPLVLAAEHTGDVDLFTSIAVSFPRNPLHLAYQALDLQRFSKGRFILGLGSQIRPHIEKRFGTDFKPVADRMREQIQAIKAIFDCFQNGEELNFQGKYYRHTLMTPMFNPGPCEFGVPPILTGAFGPKMCRMAGEVADGMFVHPFNNLPYIDGHVIPKVREGLTLSGRSKKAFVFSIAAMVVTGSTQEQFDNAYHAVRSLLAFYGSTPAYLPALQAVGYADLQPELNRLSKAGRASEMDALITDELMHQFAVIAEPKKVGAALMEKFATRADRLSIYAPYYVETSLWQQIISDIKKLQSPNK